MPFVI